MKVFKYTLLAILFFVCVAHMALGNEVSSEALAEVDLNKANSLEVADDTGALLEVDADAELAASADTELARHHHHHHHHRRRRHRRRIRRFLRRLRRHRRRHHRRHRRHHRRHRHRRHRRRHHKRRHHKRRRHARVRVVHRGPSASHIARSLHNARRQHNRRCAVSCKSKAARRYPAFLESGAEVTSTANAEVAASADTELARHHHHHHHHRRRRHRRRIRRFLRRLRRHRRRHHRRHRRHHRRHRRRVRRHRRRHHKRRHHKRRHHKRRHVRTIYRAKKSAYAALARRVHNIVRGPCNCRSAMLIARRRQAAIRARRAAAAARRRRSAIARKMRLAAIRARRAAAAARRRARKAAAARRRAARQARKLARSVPRRYRRRMMKKLKRKLVKKIPHPKHRRSTRGTHNKLDNAIAKVHRATTSLAKLKKKMHAMRKALSSKSLHDMMKMETEGAVARYLKKIGYSTNGAEGAKTIRQWKEHQAVHGRKYKYIATEEPIVYLSKLKKAHDVSKEALANHETTLYFLDDQQIAENHAKKLKRAGLLNGRTN